MKISILLSVGAVAASYILSEFFFNLEVHKLQHEAVPVVEFMYLVFTCMPGELP